MSYLMEGRQPAGVRRRWVRYVLPAAIILLGVAAFFVWQKALAPNFEQTEPSQSSVAPSDEAAATETLDQSPDKASAAPTASINRTSDADAKALLNEAKALQAEGKFEPAREKGMAALEAAQTDATRTEAESLVGAVGMELLLTPRPMPEKQDYTIQPGDSLGKIARDFGTTIELIKTNNNLRSNVIQPGKRLRVFSGNWSIDVNKTRNDLVLSLNGKFFKRYRVGTGEYANTPTGEFKIADRIPQPTWWHPDGRTIPYGDPENLLGTHWLALDVKGYGIHGTWEPDTIGKQSSMGCVRLLNDDIAELFTLVTVGTPVIIEE